MEHIVTVGESAELVLNQEILRQIGAGAGDQVEIKLTGRTLTIRSLSEDEEESVMDEAMESLMNRRSKLFERLAEGAK